MAIRHLFLSALVALGALVAPVAARAQADLFAPAVFVNDRVITRYEVEQNRQFLTLLRQPGDIETLAVERLIEDALRRDAAKAAGITVGPEEVEAGMAEFAARGDLSTEEFRAFLGQSGIAPETFRAFVEAGLLWREVVSTRFGPRAQVTDAEIDRALALSSRQSGVQVLLSELILRADSAAARAEAEAVAQRLAGQFVSEGAFAAEARARSVSASRGAGGRLDWLPIGNLPPPVAAQVIGLAPGQVSQPFPVTNAIVLFYLRDLRETGSTEAAVMALDWAEFDVASVEEALRVKAEVDTCDDLYGVAKGLPEERLRREIRVPAEVPDDVALELAKLDDDEATAGYNRGGRPVFLMLCARTYELPEAEVPPETAETETEGEGEGEPAETAQDASGGEDPTGAAAAGASGGGPSREQVRAQLLNQRLGAYADGYLAELRADATIRYP
jgi:peptidyl-prolyl cis-trans isomerase SurA